MLTNPQASIDYRQPGVWERLAALFYTLEPIPSRNCGYVECEPSWSWRPIISDYDLWFVVKGRGQLQVGEHIYPVRPGTLILLRPGDQGWATQTPEERLTVTYVHFDFFVPDQPRRAGVDSRWLPARHVLFGDVATFDRLLKQLVHLIKLRHQPLAVAEARLILQQALLKVYRQDAVQQGLAPAHLDPRVACVITHLRSYPSSRFSLEEMACMAGLSTDYFSRLLKQEVGKSFRGYALEVRLERGQHLLKESAMTVSEVAHALGYDDVFLFSRQFKQHYSYPPSLARQTV